MNDDIISLSDESYYHGSAVIMGDPSYLTFFPQPFGQKCSRTPAPMSKAAKRHKK